MLLRALFWFSLVVMLLPVETDQLDEQQNVGGGQTMMLFQSIAQDFSGFCEREPDACVTAKGLARQFGSKLQAHAENLGSYLASMDQEEDPVTTGAIKSDKQGRLAE